jgi:hypothetical protein
MAQQKEEEIEALKLVFRKDGSNPYKDDAYNINGFSQFNRIQATRFLRVHSCFLISEMPH